MSITHPNHPSLAGLLDSISRLGDNVRSFSIAAIASGNNKLLISIGHNDGTYTDFEIDNVEGHKSPFNRAITERFGTPITGVSYSLCVDEVVTCDVTYMMEDRPDDLAIASGVIAAIQDHLNASGRAIKVPSIGEDADER